MAQIKRFSITSLVGCERKWRRRGGFSDSGSKYQNWNQTNNFSVARLLIGNFR
jgi:hypothetical protein